MKRNVYKKLFLGVLTTSILISFLYWVFSWQCSHYLPNLHNIKTKRIYRKIVPHKQKKVKDSKTCHDITTKPTLKDILDQNPNENSIYFVDSSCDSYKRGRITLTKRHACAIEAAARFHLNRTVYVLYGSPGIIKNTGTESDTLLTALTGYKNIGFFHVNPNRFFRNTPAEKIYRVIRMSPNKVEFLDEMIRLVLLWKYGGTFIGPDLLLIKNLHRLPNNFLVAKNGRIDDVIMRFDRKEKGMVFLNETFRQFEEIYESGDVHRYGEVVTRTFKKICDTMGISEAIAKYCAGIKIFPPSYFMFYRPEKLKRYFDENRAKVLQNVERSYGIRLWEEKSKEFKVSLNSTSAYLFLAKKFCPQTVKYSKNYI